MKANKNDGIAVQKGGQVIKFDVRVEMPKGVLWCEYVLPEEQELIPESYI